MSEAYVPATEIPLEDLENPEYVPYQFNPVDFTAGSSAISLDYFNLLLAQQTAADEAAAAATAAQIASQASSMASSDALLASGIALTQSFLASNTAGDVVQSNAISALEGNVSLLQDALSTLSGGVATAIATAQSNTSALETSINSQIVDISGAIADIESEVSTNSGSIASIEADISTLQSTSSANAGNISLMQSDISSNTFDISSINAAIALLAPLDNPEFSTQVTMPQLVLNGSIITNSTNISPVEISYLNNASSNIQSQLDSATTSIALKADALDAVLTGNATCVTQADGNNSTRLANTQFVQTAIANLIGSAPSTMNTLQELAEVLQNSPDAISSLTTTVGLKAPILNASMTGNTSFANISVSGTASFPVSSISSAAIDNTHFATLTGSQTINGAKSFTALSTVNKMCENFYSMGTLGSSTASIDYANGSCFYMTPMSSANLTLAISNVPTSNQSCAYSITSMINTGTYKVYGNSCSINGTGVTLVSSGGLSSISVDPSASFVIQQLNIMFDGSSNPSRVISSVNSFF